MFEFVKKWFFTGLAFLSTLTSVNSLSCISIKNQECKVRPQIVNVNNILLVLKQANALVVAIMSKMCVPDVAKNWNVKAFNLMSRSNETRHIKWQETCKCKCRLDASVSNNKQRWNNDKCWCGCKELIDKACVTKDLFGILVIVSANMINRVMLVSIWTMKIVSAEKNYLTK